jgi:antitoxin YefM
MRQERAISAHFCRMKQRRPIGELGRRVRLTCRCLAPQPPDRRAGTSGTTTGGVTTILVMSEVTLPLAEIKKRLSEIVEGVQQRHDRVVLTRNGRPAAVIMSPEDLEALEETLDILSNPAAMREIHRAEREVEAGKVVTGEELRATYLKR